MIIQSNNWVVDSLKNTKIILLSKKTVCYKAAENYDFVKNTLLNYAFNDAYSLYETGLYYHVEMTMGRHAKKSLKKRQEFSWKN